MILKPSEKKQLIQLALASIKGDSIDLSTDLREKLKENLGVFVTLNKHGELRGCIGFPEPVLPLGNAIRDAARAAAYHDPRFLPVSKEEIKDLHIEITLLTKPELIKSNYIKNIHIGKDGLIVKNQYASGLLLPQVATEWGWGAKEFLSQTCVKAGLNADAWKDKAVKVYKFQGEIISS